MSLEQRLNYSAGQVKRLQCLSGALEEAVGVLGVNHSHRRIGLDAASEGEADTIAANPITGAGAVVPNVYEHDANRGFGAVTNPKNLKIRRRRRVPYGCLT